jgi:mannan endo-1,4-beta-mannosidase
MTCFLIKKTALLLILTNTNVFNAQNSNTFFTKNGKLFDSNGNEFIIRGINNPHIWFPDASFKALDTIASFGTNAVRIIWQKRGTANELRKIIERVVELKMIAIPEIHDATGKNKIFEYYFTPKLTY